MNELLPARRFLGSLRGLLALVSLAVASATGATAESEPDVATAVATGQVAPPAAATAATGTTSTAGAIPTPPEGAATEPPLSEVVVEAAEPRFVAPTTRDRIGRIWAPVLIDGKGPFRLVLDTGANHSAIIPATAKALGNPPTARGVVVTGFTGSAVVPTISVSRMEVGDLLIGPTTLPIVADVFGGAEGVLGNEGLIDKRIFADFRHDQLIIEHSHGEPARNGFTVVLLKVIEGGLLMAEIRVGGIHCRAIIDTGAQATVGNLPLREALLRHPPRDISRTEIEGVTLDVQTGDNVPAPQIQMGGITINGVHIIFGDMYLFEHYKMTSSPVLLLGMDLLGSFDTVILDYRMRQMQLRLNRAQLPP